MMDLVQCWLCDEDGDARGDNCAFHTCHVMKASWTERFCRATVVKEPFSLMWLIRHHLRLLVTRYRALATYCIRMSGNCRSAVR